MASKVWDRYHEHTHVSLKIDSPSFEGPLPIVWHTGTHVWVVCSYADTLPADVVQVGDGRSNSYDEDGDRIVSVPVSYVTSYYTDDEAAGIQECMDIDARLLAYAKG
jgi:hypothetical protein